MRVSGVPRLQDAQRKLDLPIINNEYAWLWLNRDGTPTCLTAKVYENLLGPDSTTEERRLLYAKSADKASVKVMLRNALFVGSGSARKTESTVESAINASAKNTRFLLVPSVVNQYVNLASLYAQSVALHSGLIMPTHAMFARG